jgi:uncharacterized protein YraI
MPGNACHPHSHRPWKLLSLGAALLAFTLAPAPGLAQTTTPQPTYAANDLNLRKGPGGGDDLLRVVPQGAQVTPLAGTERNGYVQVSYGSTTGWLLADGLVYFTDATPPAQTLPAAPAAPAAPDEESLELFAQDARVTLAPLMLRSGPELSAEPIAGMPEGSLVTLTREGYANGYVTVDYGGAQGWAYADFLAAPEEAG